MLLLARRLLPELELLLLQLAVVLLLLPYHVPLPPESPSLSELLLLLSLLSLLEAGLSFSLLFAREDLRRLLLLLLFFRFLSCLLLLLRELLLPFLVFFFLSFPADFLARFFSRFRFFLRKRATLRSCLLTMSSALATLASPV
jgi:hypothetical protein